MVQDLENTEDDLVLSSSPDLANKPAEIVQPMDALIAGEALETRFAVNAPYWLNGLQNKSGLEVYCRNNRVE